MFSSLNKRDKNNNIIYSNRGKQVGLTKTLFGLGNIFIGGLQSYFIRSLKNGQFVIGNIFNNRINNKKHKIKYCHIGSLNHQYQSICLIDNDGNMYMAGAGYNNDSYFGQFYETNIKPSIFYQSKLNNIIPKKVMFNQCDSQGHFCIMMSQDNQLYYCGRNDYIWGSVNKFTMFNIKQFDIKDFCVGVKTIYALDENGFVWGCGYNANGQLACGNWNDHYSDWVTISPPQGQKFIKVISYYLTTYFLTDKGNIYGCGNSSCYQLGSSTSDKNNIVKLNGNIKCKDIACGFYHFIAQDYDNNIYGMGRNEDGQLGVGDYANRNSMTKIPYVKAQKIFAGGYNSYYVDMEGFLHGTGLNYYQQIAYGMPIKINNFNKFKNYTNIKQVCCTKYTTMILGEQIKDV